MASSYFIFAGLIGGLFALVALFHNGRFSSGLLGFAFFGSNIGLLVSYLFMPAINPFFATTVITIVLLFWFALLMLHVSEDTFSGSPATLVGACLTVLTIIVMVATTFSMFHSDRYASLLVPNEEKRDTSMPLIDQSQARLVTPKLARKRAAELLSSSDEQGIGSRVVIGEMWGNEIDGTMWWIAPLEHSGFFRWLNFDNTPGYIMVSQFNELNAKFVQDKPIKYGIEAWYWDNVYRHLYANGHVSYSYEDAVFQIDDEGNPHWLVGMSEPQVGFAAYMPVRWALVDANTGDISIYDDPADVPEWVDRLYPQDIIANRFDDWGCFSQGFGSCWFSKQNVIQSTPGISITINPSGEIIYYSGTQFANAKAEGASSGVFITNARTAETTFYPRAGITETAAKSVMDQAYANFDGYRADTPLLLSINGMEAYFAIVLDAAGVRKGFAIVAQDNRNTIGTGNSVQAAVSDFMRSMQRSKRDLAFESGSGSSGHEFEGLVVTYLPYVQNGRTVFYVSIDTLPNKILEVSEEKISEIVATKVGDPVRVSVDNTQPGIVYVTSFDNLRVNLSEEGLQPVVDKKMEDAFERFEEDKKRADAEALLEGLSQEDLDKLLMLLRSAEDATNEAE